MTQKNFPMLHREKVLAHAEQRLVAQGKPKPTELLSLYKKFLKIENHRLQLKHYAGGGGREIAEQRATLVDIVLRHLFEPRFEMANETAAKAVSGLALVAIGGYGRGELNPCSDVDIMFLQKASTKTPTPQVNQVVQSILYMLWDVGFKVGHSTRSIPGAVKQANADPLSKTALLEARFIAGDKALFDSFKVEFKRRCVRGFEAAFLAERVINQRDRHEKYGGSVYMQEPNIKNSCGGLRDYQNLLWVSYFKEGVSTTQGLVEKKLLQEAERRKLERAYDFLLRVRTELHYINKRPTDVLGLNFQLQIATKFQYTNKNILRRGEAFMKDYYQHARATYHITELLSNRLCGAQERPGFFRSLMHPEKEEHFDGFHSKAGAIYPDSRDIFNQDPFRMMRMFLHVQQRDLVLSPEIQQLLLRRLHLIDRTFQYARANRETFIAIISQKGRVGRILRMMHEVDFLGRYLPEFGQLTCLVQHEFFHRYTADEHTLVCIEKLDRLIDTEEPRMADYKALFQRLEDPCVIYLALILHDTGKASNARYHAEASALFAQKVAARLQLSSERRKTLILLVDNHLVLSSTAQRRNVEDPATVAEFANVVKTQAGLNALMLMTLADGQGTGDENWSDWKESLVWQLYRGTTRYLADGESYYRERQIQREDIRRATAKKLTPGFADELEAHFEYMPDAYFQNYSPADVAAHIRLFRSFLEARYSSDEFSLAPAVQWVAHPNQGHSEVWICSWDRNEVLAKIAGSFSVAQLNILSADIYSRGDNLVLDIFRVCTPRFEAVSDEKEIAQVGKLLNEALGQESFDFSPLLKKARRRRNYTLSQEIDLSTRIVIDNNLHPVYSLVEIQTPDRLGLLYHLLMGFDAAGVNIALSRITTEKGAAIDSFYVTNSEGKKIRSAETIADLQKSLQRSAESCD